MLPYWFGSIDPTDNFTDEAITANQKHTNGQIIERELQVQIYIPSVSYCDYYGSLIL